MDLADLDVDSDSYDLSDYDDFGAGDFGGDIGGDLGGGDFYDQQTTAQMLLRSVRPVFGSISDPATLSLTVQTRNQAGKLPPASPKSRTLVGTGRIPYRISGRYLRPEFTFNGFVQQFRGFEPYLEQRGLR